MDFVLKPSLEHRAAVKIVVALWNHEDIRTLVAKFSPSFRKLVWYDEGRNMWKIVENKATESVSKLPLPESSKTEVSRLVKPIGLEILKWKDFHADFFQNSNADIPLVLKSLCWKLQGTVDRKKTAEAMIENRYLSVTKSYELACVYCLEDYIERLWTEIRRQDPFSYSVVPGEIDRNGLVFFWTHLMKRSVDRMRRNIERNWRDCTPLQFAFEYAAIYNHKIATEYFLKKLSPKERKDSLGRYAEFVVIRHSDSKNVSTAVLHVPSEFTVEVLCFLLPQLGKAKQIELFQKFPDRVLRCLLVWPWQGFIMETAKLTRGFLGEWDFYHLLEEISKKIVYGYRDFCYQELFEIIWRQGSVEHNKFVRDRCGNKCLTQYLFEVGDKTLINLVWKGANFEQKLGFIFNYSGIFNIEDLISEDKWDLVEFFIKEFIPTREHMIQFARYYKKVITKVKSIRPGREEEMKEKFDRVCKLLDHFAEKEF